MTPFARAEQPHLQSGKGKRKYKWPKKMQKKKETFFFVSLEHLETDCSSPSSYGEDSDTTKQQNCTEAVIVASTEKKGRFSLLIPQVFSFLFLISSYCEPFRCEEQLLVQNHPRLPIKHTYTKKKMQTEKGEKKKRSSLHNQGITFVLP